MNRIRATQRPHRSVCILSILVALALLAGQPSAWLLVAQGQGGEQPLDVLLQSGGGTLFFTPTPAYVDVGSTVTISICMADVEELNGLDFRFDYDDALVSALPLNNTITYADPGIFLPGDYFQVYNRVNVIAGGRDEVRFAAAKLNPAPPITGDACVGTIQFTGVAEGITTLHFTFVKAGDIDGLELDPKTVPTDGLIVVGEAADLAIAKTCADFRTAEPYYRLTVTNSGPHSAASPTIVDDIPVEATLDTPLVYTSKLTTSGGTVNQGTCSAAGQTVTCDLGVALPPTTTDPTSQWVVDTYVTDSTTTSATVSNTATVSSTTLDAVLTNNADTCDSTTPARIIKFVPQISGMYLSGTVSVKVCLEDVVDLYGIGLKFNFMKSIVSVPSTPVDPLWEVFDPLDHSIFFNRVNTVDATYDQVEYVVTNQNPAGPFTGSGCIGSIDFGGLAVGTTPLDFVYVRASNRDAEELPLNWEDGSIWVLHPTNVTLSHFSARPLGRSVRVLWTTEQESDLLGFNLYRAEDLESEPVRLNETIIPGSAPGSPIGATYQFADRTVEPDVRYYYWLEYVAVDGGIARYGPQSAAIGRPWSYPSIY